MAINANHPFEELDGIKCAVVEKNCSDARAAFLKSLLEFNGYTVVVAKSPPPKAAPAKPAAAVAPEAPAPEPPPAPLTFSVGVTHVAFNAINAIYGRLLKTPDGHVVTMAYWKQLEPVSNDQIPYYERGV